MPRRARIALPHVPLHLVQRGLNHQPCFFSDDDRATYLRWLADCCADTGCAVHAYVLMPDHVHLLLTPSRVDAAGAMMKRLSQRYVQHVNRNHGRSGTLWDGRFRSCVVQDSERVLTCCRYIELNPVRSGMVRCPAEYAWSSYRANAVGEASAIVTPHNRYRALGPDDAAQAAAYRQSFLRTLDEDTMGAIRDATNGNYVLGDPSFKLYVRRALGCRVERGRPGRPRARPSRPHPAGRAPEPGAPSVGGW